MRSSITFATRYPLSASLSWGEPPFRTWLDKLTIEKVVQRYGGVYHRSPPRLRIMLRAAFTGLVSP
jgi:hypothetical protein